MLFCGGKVTFAVINEKLGPFISWMGIECSRTSGTITCFIAAGSLLQLSRCLSGNSSRLYVQNFVLPVFATFPIRESSMNKCFLWELVDLFRFRFYVLFILFIRLSILMLATYYDVEKWLWRFKIPKQI